MVLGLVNEMHNTVLLTGPDQALPVQLVTEHDIGYQLTPRHCSVLTVHMNNTTLQPGLPMINEQADFAA